MTVLPKPIRVKLAARAYRALCLRVHLRDGWACRLCKRALPLQAHHLRKRSQGRRDTLANLVSLCARCHADVEAHRIDVIGDDAGATLRFVAHVGKWADE